jgi:hypothetical protein
MIFQIIKEDPNIAESIVADMEGSKGSESILASRESLWRLMEKMLDGIRVSEVCCLVDGLDECDQDSVEFLRQNILRLASKGTRSGTTRRVRWIVLSRDLGSLPGFVHISLDDLQDKVNQDIQRVVVFTVDKIVATGLDKDSKKSLKKGILVRAEGSFLWAGPLVREIARSRSMKDIIEAIHSLPTGLDDLYERMLWEITPKSRNMCAAVLWWLALALNPLNLAELAEALKLTGTTKMPAIGEMRHLIHECGPIVKLQGDQVSLGHNSAE